MKRMNLKLATVGAAALAAGAVGLTSAYATTGHTSIAPASGSQTDGDNVNVQQGDQTTPDVPGAKSESGEASTPESGVTATSVTAPKAESRSVTESATEAPSAESDGPGGHQDSGNADHQFNGNE
jgi:hypothetical protein